VILKDKFGGPSPSCSDHTHASHAGAGGMPIEVAQQNLGHASLAMATVYAGLRGKGEWRR
jgi:integrase